MTQALLCRLRFATANHERQRRRSGMSDRASDGVNILRFARAVQHQASVSNCVQVGAHRPVVRSDLHPNALRV